MMKTNVTVDGEFNDRIEESVYDSHQYAAAAAVDASGCNGTADPVAMAPQL